MNRFKTECLMRTLATRLWATAEDKIELLRERARSLHQKLLS